MTGLDTNVLARYYVQTAKPDAATQRQQEAARRLIEGGQRLHVAKTVLLELEWVMRGAYACTPNQFASVLGHLLASPHVTLEDRLSVEAALASHLAGLDFADALHHAAYRVCDGMASFDDRKFARRAAKLGLVPKVTVPR